MRSCAFAAAVVAFGTSLGGCAATTTTSKVAVDYNRIFAKSRDEVLVTNILRASAREPLQFSTMGTVTGGVRNSGSLTVPLTNLIGGTAGLIISPSTTLNEGINPSVTIIPLSNKEFTEGILKPVTPETINYFLNQGWDPELILQLAVGGIACPNGAMVFNRGDPTPGAHYDDFVAMFREAPRSPIKTTDPSGPIVIRMPSKEAVALLKDGVGKGRKVEKLEPVFDRKRQTELVDVTISKAGEQQLTGLSTEKVCAGQGARDQERVDTNLSLLAIAPNAHGQAQGKAILRSVESIIYFLGETQRSRLLLAGGCGPASGPADWPYYIRTRPRNGVEETRRLTLLRLDRSCDRQPVAFPTFAQTRFNDNYYYVLRQNDAGEEDRSLTTLSFLNELIALQTSESSIASATPVIAIQSK